MEVLLKDRIKLEPKLLCKRYDVEILRQLKNKLEGKCSKHGYIKEDTIKIHKITPGVIELSSLCGMVIYEIYFYAEICNPIIGSIVQGVVRNTNRFGILVESPPVMDIIIAKNSVNILSEINLEEVKLDQILTIEIIGKKYELGDKRITVIGRAVKETKKSEPKTSSALTLDVNSDDEVEPDVIEAEIDDEEKEEEEEEEVEAEADTEAAEAEEVESLEGGSLEFDLFNDEDGGGDDYEIFASSDEGEYENDD